MKMPSKNWNSTRTGAALHEKAAAERAWLSKHYGKDSEIVITEQRYGYIRGALMEAVRKVPIAHTPRDGDDR